MDKKPDWNVLRNIANPVSNLAQSSSLFCLQLILGNDGELCGLRCGPQVSQKINTCTCLHLIKEQLARLSTLYLVQL